MSARTSLVINDLRQAMLTLNPSIKNSFDLVKFHSHDGNLVFSLPPTSTMTSPENPFFTKFDVPVMADPANALAGDLGTLTFYHNSWTALKWAILAWTLLLFLAVPFSRWARKMIEARHRESIALENANARALIAKQVAHDIRSPLSALMIVEKSIQGLREEQRNLLVGAAQRIGKIAEDLLEQSQPQGVTSNVAAIVDEVRKEKQVTLSGARVVLSAKDIPPVSAAISPGVLARMISNILNNAIEAIEGSGTVTIEGSESQSWIEIVITDTGRGIPEHLMAKIGKPGVTEGKAGGHGLGLSHAIQSARACGGDVIVQSQLGQGTTITLRLPKNS